MNDEAEVTSDDSTNTDQMPLAEIRDKHSINTVVRSTRMWIRNRH